MITGTHDSQQSTKQCSHFCNLVISAFSCPFVPVTADVAYVLVFYLLDFLSNAVNHEITQIHKPKS